MGGCPKGAICRLRAEGQAVTTGRGEGSAFQRERIGENMASVPVINSYLATHPQKLVA